MSMHLKSPFLCCITADTSCPATQAEKALKGGATMIQLRQKTASGSALCSWSLRIHELCRAFNALFIINDRIDIALAAGADGVHLGQQDLPADAARKLLGDNKVIGVSVSSAEEAEKAEKDGCDYVGLGHIFPTSSKKKTGEPLGPSRITEIFQRISLPIIAIGGLTAGNASGVIEAGASGIAVISAVADAPDPQQAASELIQTMQSSLQ